MPCRQRKLSDQVLLWRIEPEQHDAPTVRIASLNRALDRPPRGLARLRLEFPPVGLKADRIKPVEYLRGCRVRKAAMLSRDNLKEELVPGAAARIVGDAKGRLL